MSITKKTILEAIVSLKSIYSISITKKEIDYIIESWKGNIDNWNTTEFWAVIYYIEDNTDKFPEFPKPTDLIRAFKFLELEKREKEIKGCKKCNYSGYRHYRTFVDWFDFETKTIIKKKMPCIAACGCDLGRKKKKEDPDLFWYNDVIKRSDVELFEEEVDMEKVLKPIIDKTELDDIEELPF